MSVFVFLPCRFSSLALILLLCSCSTASHDFIENSLFHTSVFRCGFLCLSLSVSFDFIVAFYSSIEIYQCQMEPSNFTKSHSIIQQNEWAAVEKNWTGCLCLVCLRWKSMPPPSISSFDHSSHDSLRILCLDFKFIHFAIFFFSRFDLIELLLKLVVGWCMKWNTKPNSHT